MNAITVPLADALGIGRDDGEESPSSLLASAIGKSIATFSCAKSEYHAEFLKNTALRHHLDNVSKTYLVLDADVLARAVQGDPGARADGLVAAYFTIGLSSLVLTSHGFGKKRQDKIRSRMFSRDESIGCFVIGSLCRADGCPKDSLPGRTLLEECLAVIAEAQERVGGSLVLVESRRSVFEAIYSPTGFRELYESKNKTADGAPMIVSGLNISNLR